MNPLAPTKPNLQNLSSCNDCGGLISNEAPICPHCGKRYDSTKKSAFPKIVISLLFIGVALAGILSAVLLVTSLATATGAPQEAAAAAICSALVIIPYCFARAIAFIFGEFRK